MESKKHEKKGDDGWMVRGTVIHGGTRAKARGATVNEHGPLGKDCVIVFFLKELTTRARVRGGLNVSFVSLSHFSTSLLHPPPSILLVFLSF